MARKRTAVKRPVAGDPPAAPDIDPEAVPESVTCPYSGKPITPKFLPGPNLWTTEGGFDPLEPRSRGDLMFMLRLRRGKMPPGADAVSEVRCPYTGTEIAIEELPTGRCRARGGFSPRGVWGSKREAMFDCATQAGKSKPTFSREPPKVVVVDRTPENSDVMEGMDSSADVAAEVVDRILS